jgi:hypothetical protein
MSQLDSDLPNWNAPTSEQLALTLKNVLVENVHRRLDGQLVRVVSKRLAGQAHGLTDCVFRDAATPFFNNTLPRHAGCYLLKNISYKDASATKCGLSMANLRVGDDMATDHFFAHGKSILCHESNDNNAQNRLG